MKRPTGWKDEYPFTSKWIDSGDGRMHYVDEYAGRVLIDSSTDNSSEQDVQTLLFVHGNPTWSFHWRRFIVALRQDFRCVALDHLGCGLSAEQSRPLRLADHIKSLRGLVKALNLQHVTLVAQDWGGAIGLGALLEERERFERIVLFNTGAFPPPRIPWRISACRIPLLGKALVQGCNAFSLAALRMTLARKSRLSPATVSGYLSPYDSWRRRAAVYNFVRDIPGSRRHPTWQVLEQIEAGLSTIREWPILVIWGMRDWCFTPDCLGRLCQAWPRSEVHRLADVGHWVVEDAAEESLAITLDFLKRTSSAGTESGLADGRLVDLSDGASENAPPIDAAQRASRT